MDFFDEMAAACERDARRRGVRVAPDDWQAFQGAAVKANPAPEPEPPAAVAAASCRSMDGPPQSSTAALPADWDELRRLAGACRRCRLAEQRHHVVFGEGNVHARLMFIGEGPGADEDATGRPFVGVAGQLLDKMISAMRFAREDVYIANVVKCRPPENRMPGDDEAAECLGYLRKQIALVRPEVIVLLGGTALRFVLRMDGIMRNRGRWFEYESIPVMPTFHPAFLLRKPEAKRDAWHDLKLVMARLGVLNDPPTGSR